MQTYHLQNNLKQQNEFNLTQLKVSNEQKNIQNMYSGPQKMFTLVFAVPPCFQR